MTSKTKSCSLNVGLTVLCNNSAIKKNLYSPEAKGSRTFWAGQWPRTRVEHKQAPQLHLLRGAPTLWVRCELTLKCVYCAPQDYLTLQTLLLTVTNSCWLQCRERKVRRFELLMTWLWCRRQKKTSILTVYYCTAVANYFFLGLTKWNLRCVGEGWKLTIYWIILCIYKYLTLLSLCWTQCLNLVFLII